MTGPFPPLSSPRSLRVGVVSQGDERYICKLFAEKVKELQLQSWGAQAGEHLRNTSLVMEALAFWELSS